METKNLKILFLTVSSTSFFYDQLVIPFGLISIASYVEGKGYTLKGIEMNSPSEKTLSRYLKVDDDLLREITDYGPDIVAMSTYASNIYNAVFWAGVIKENLPECTVILGGNHVSYIAEECLKKYPAADMVVRFEGEIPFKMICEKLADGETDFGSIPGITYRDSSTVVSNELHTLIDLKKLPQMNLELFEDQSKKKDEIEHADMLSSRGCPFHCTFCNCNHYWGKKYRVKNEDQVVQELRDLKRRYPNLKSIRFRDDPHLTEKKLSCFL